MKKRTLIAMLTVVMMVFTLVPAVSFAAPKDPKAEDIMEEFEYVYMESIKDKSKYSSEVWQEIQDVYKEGREYYLTTTWEEVFGDDFFFDEEEFTSYEPEEIDYMNLLALMGQLTWVKEGDELKAAKDKYLKDINTTYKAYKKANYNDYNWDMIQDCLYVGKNQINSAESYREVVSGYYYAMQGMMFATDKETLKMFRKDAETELKQFVYLYLDPAKFSAPVWASVETLYKEAIAALQDTQTVGEISKVVDEYGEKLAELTGKTYPMSEDEYYALLESLMKDVIDFYDEMDPNAYSMESMWEAEEIVWNLEWELEEVATREAAQKKVDKAMKQLKAIPTKEQELEILNAYAPKVTAKGVTATSIKVTWPANKNMHGYAVYRSTAKNGKYKLVRSIYFYNSTSFTDTKLTFGKNYYYKVKGFRFIDNKIVYSKASKPVKATPKLSAPGVTLSKVGSSDVQLKWKKVTGAKGYEIYRSNSINGAFKKVKTIKSGDTLKWKDTSTKKGKTYCYKMRSYTTKADGTKRYSGYSTIKTIKR